MHKGAGMCKGAGMSEKMRHLSQTLCRRNEYTWFFMTRHWGNLCYYKLCKYKAVDIIGIWNCENLHSSVVVSAAGGSPHLLKIFMQSELFHFLCIFCARGLVNPYKVFLKNYQCFSNLIIICHFWSIFVLNTTNNFVTLLLWRKRFFGQSYRSCKCILRKQGFRSEDVVDG